MSVAGGYRRFRNAAEFALPMIKEAAPQAPLTALPALRSGLRPRSRGRAVTEPEPDHMARAARSCSANNASSSAHDCPARDHRV
jgi:hypothetical protein